MRLVALLAVAALAGCDATDVGSGASAPDAVVFVPDALPAADAAAPSGDARPGADAAATCADGTSPRPGGECAAPPDAGAADASPDTGVADASPDAGPDTGVADAAPDATVPDAAADAEAPDAATPDATDPGPPPCDPPLALEPPEAVARAFDLVTFHADGGTGAWRFTLADDTSGALLNHATGAYLAGETVGGVDRVRLTDARCAGEAVATVRVVPDMVVRPREIEVAFGAHFTFAPTLGSGEYAYEMVEVGAGGRIEPDGTYTAGMAAGSDVVRVRDARTGQSEDALVRVAAAAPLRPRPPALFLPVGARHPLEVAGGSGHFEATVEGDGVRYDAGAVVAEAPGTAVVALRDAFTGQRTAVTVTAVPAQQAPLPRVGDASSSSTALGPGDLDGDGFADALLGMPEADLGGVDAGAVYVYRGGPAGLRPEPALVLGTGERRAGFGRALAVADFDGDGRRDLAVGAAGADIATSDTGAVYLYPGVDGGLFAVEPARVLAAPNAGDQLGFALAACDFNGDGRADLAATALRAEDRDRTPQATNQGGVFVFLGYEDGLLARPDRVVWGEAPDANGTWDAVANLGLGSALAAGDVDGDGLCDLVAGAADFAAGPGRSRDGAVFVFPGVAPDDVAPGGVRPLPARAWAGLHPDDNTSEFGRRLAVADLDGDGLAEVVAGQYRHDRDANRRDAGAVRVFAGAPFGGEDAPALLPAESAAWTWAGEAGFDNVGWDLSVADVTGDGLPDVVSADWADEVAGGGGDAGVIRAFAAVAGGWPALAPVAVRAGGAAGDRLGESVVVLGDADGDGRADLLAHAGRNDALGPDVGRPFFLAGDPEIAPVALDIPADPTAGGRLGWTAAVVGDADGDGRADLVLGAPFLNTARGGARTGAAFVYRGGEAGFSVAPDLDLTEVPGQTASDLFGYAVAPAGAFDGDDDPDYALAARADEAPSALGNDYVADPDCATRRSNGGGVHVFRGRTDLALPARPGFVYFAPENNVNLQTVAGGADVDGDGYDDLIAGSYQWNVDGRSEAGGVVVVRGRGPAPDGRIRLICDAIFRHSGAAASDRVGWSVAALGDVDGDGCDEVAFGAPLESAGGVTRQGAVRVLFGWGGPGCRAAPALLHLAPGEANAQAGHALAAGDLDGDGVPELVVGAVNHARDRQAVGGAWVVTGRFMAGLTPDPVGTTTWQPFTPPGQAAWIVEGRVSGERFGSSVAVLPGGRFAVGAPLGAYSGVPQVGGARVYRVERGALDPEPVAALVGETWRPGDRLGEALAAGVLGGRPVLVVGGYDGSGAGVDSGSAYVLTFEPN